MGDDKDKKSYTRIIAASNDNQILGGKTLSSGFISRFRYVIRVPSLKYRQSDIPLLIKYFTEEKIKISKLPSSTKIPNFQVDILKERDWQYSNVRGLKNAVNNLIMRSSTSTFTAKKKGAGPPQKVTDKQLEDCLTKAVDVNDLRKKLFNCYKGNGIKFTGKAPYSSKSAMITRIQSLKKRARKLEQRFRGKFFNDY